MAADGKSSILNFNVGVLGHIDSGKTSLVKLLSTTQSTACFDKNPQSRERGITLDLGFSSFSLPAPPHISGLSSDSNAFSNLSINSISKPSSNSPLQTPDPSLPLSTTTTTLPSLPTYQQVQFTLVDCPGHASLIKTIIGGAQIVDMVMLVVDVNKGFQTQTAECLVISEIMANRMLVVMNKVDLLAVEKRDAMVEKMKKRILKTLDSTKFKDSTVIAVSANSEEPIGIDELKEVMRTACFRPQRSALGAFLFAVDHCFLIKGQGTVMTGTVLSGSVSVNDTVEIASLRDVKKVKSIQMFKKSVSKGVQGDRIGVCVAGLESKNLERGLVSSPGYLANATDVVALIYRVKYFKGRLISKAGKLHLTLGHGTQMATCVFFRGGGVNGGGSIGGSSGDRGFKFEDDYPYVQEFSESPDDDEAPPSDHPHDHLHDHFYTHIHLDQPLPCHPGMLLIASKLDSDVHANACRIAFHGKIVHAFVSTDGAASSSFIGGGGGGGGTKVDRGGRSGGDDGGKGGKCGGDGGAVKVLSDLKVFKEKMKEGVVDRKMDEYTVVVKDLFKKESKIELFQNLKVTLSSGEVGVVEGSFGQSGKVKVNIPGGLSPGTSQQLTTSSSSKKTAKKAAVTEEAEAATPKETIRVTLRFKKYIYKHNHKIISL